MELTPKQIVRELDRYIIGQDAARSCPQRSAMRSSPRIS